MRFEYDPGSRSAQQQIKAWLDCPGPNPRERSEALCSICGAADTPIQNHRCDRIHAGSGCGFPRPGAVFPVVLVRIQLLQDVSCHIHLVDIALGQNLVK